MKLTSGLTPNTQRQNSHYSVSINYNSGTVSALGSSSKYLLIILTSLIFANCISEDENSTDVSGPMALPLPHIEILPLLFNVHSL